MSDEKEKLTEKVEAEMEAEEIIEHWSHKHPLTLVETRTGDYCYGCDNRFSIGEKAYGCSIKGCGYEKLLHEECAEVARKIHYPIEHHAKHILTLRHEPDLWKCKICTRTIWSIGYRCTSFLCGFQMHMRCAQVGGGVIDATADADEQSRNIIRIHHPSHPEHELKLLRRKCSFNCDACGTSRGRGSSYTCTTDDCQYWIHERCASLPQSIRREDHHHSLSISFHVPLEYVKNDYKCDVCNKDLRTKNWIYHCQLCRVVVHLKCAFNKSSRALTFTHRNDAKDIIHLPPNDVAEELIAPFVMRQGGVIPHDDVMNVKYKFLHHQHQLTLISSSYHHQNKEATTDEDDYDDGKRSEVIICDGCITPIFPSSASYMSCTGEDCNYNLHMACFHLPHELPSHPFHLEEDHHLILQSSFDKLQPWEFKKCSVCEYPTNGLYYACTKCNSFRVDIKCASLGDNLYHAAHPQHLLNYVTWRAIRRDTYTRRLFSCVAGCNLDIDDYDCYKCSTCSCDFIVHVRCALLPASVTSRKWDKKHPLPLTYDANLNHPGDFYCDQCEGKMNPKSWMYHCRHCDISFHPKCFRLTSGENRNVKYGQQYVIAAAHPHNLTFQLLTMKRCCDLCHRYRYEKFGFQCTSCNFFICIYCCGTKAGDIQAID